MDREERKIVFAAGMAHTVAHFYEILFPAMTMYIVKDMDLAIDVVIKAGFLLYLLYGCLAPFWGYIADKMGSQLALGIGMILAGVGVVFAGITHGLNALWFSLGIVGIGIAAAHPAGMALISKSVAERGRALGTFGVFGNIGIILAPLVGGIGGYYLGWRTLMILSGAFGIFAGCFSLFLNIPNHRYTEKTYTEKISNKHAVFYFVLLCIAMTIAGLIYRANLITLPVYFEENPTRLTGWLNQQQWLGENEITGRGGKEKTLGATLLISLVVLVGIIGQKIGGYTADRADLRWSYFFFFLIGLPALLLMAFLDSWGLVFVTSIFMIVSLGMQPIENSLVALLTPIKWRSTAYGIKFILSFGLGALSVWIVSFCITSWTTSSVYLVLALLQIILLIVIGVLIYMSKGIDMRQYSAEPGVET